MNLKPLPSPNGTNKAGLYIPESWPWKGPPDGAYDAMPQGIFRPQMTNAEADDYWRRKRAAKAMANDGMPRTVEEGIAYGRAWAARNAASRNRMAFDSEREDNMRDDLDPVAVSRCLGHLAGKLSPEDLEQARALLKGNNAERPITGPAIFPTYGSNRPIDNKTKDGIPKALEGTYAGEYAKAQARDAARRKAAAKDGVGSGVGTLLGGLLGSVAGPIGTAVGSQIGGELGGAAEKGLTHMITDPAQAAPPAHSGEEGDDDMPKNAADARRARAIARDSQGAYFQSDRTAYHNAQPVSVTPVNRRIGVLAQDSRAADFDRRFPEVARIKIL